MVHNMKLKMKPFDAIASGQKMHINEKRQYANIDGVNTRVAEASDSLSSSPCKND